MSDSDQATEWTDSPSGVMFPGCQKHNFGTFCSILGALESHRTYPGATKHLASVFTCSTSCFRKPMSPCPWSLTNTWSVSSEFPAPVPRGLPRSLGPGRGESAQSSSLSPWRGHPCKQVPSPLLPWEKTCPPRQTIMCHVPETMLGQDRARTAVRTQMGLGSWEIVVTHAQPW